MRAYIGAATACVYVCIPNNGFLRCPFSDFVEDEVSKSDSAVQGITVILLVVNLAK
jgi:hypothetical protein